MRDHIPFPGGPHCEEGIPQGRKSMYLPAGFSGMRMWEKALGETDAPEADFAYGGGDGAESPGKERKVTHL